MTADASPSAVEARHNMMLATHPIHSKKEAAYTLLPEDQSLAMYLEMEEDLSMRLTEVRQAIAILRDTA